MKAAELVTKKPEELQQLLIQQQQQLATATVDLRVKDVKNVKQIQAIKKDIARLRTALRQQQLTQGDAK